MRKITACLAMAFCLGANGFDISAEDRIADLNTKLEGGRKAGLSKYVPTLIETLPIAPDKKAGPDFIKKYHIELYWNEFEKMGVARTSELPGRFYDYEWSLPSIAKAAHSLGEKKLAYEALSQLIRLKRFEQSAALAVSFGDEEFAIRAGLTSLGVYYYTGYENNLRWAVDCFGMVKGDLRKAAVEILYDLAEAHRSPASLESQRKRRPHSFEEDLYSNILIILRATGDVLAEKDPFVPNFGSLTRVTDPRGVAAIRGALAKITIGELRKDHLIDHIRLSLLSIGDTKRIRELGTVFFDRARGRSESHASFYEVASQYFGSAGDKAARVEVLKAELEDPDLDLWDFQASKYFIPLAKELNCRQAVVLLKKQVQTKISHYENLKTNTAKDEDIRLDRVRQWTAVLTNDVEPALSTFP
jgi:hypothetical protein